MQNIKVKDTKVGSTHWWKECVYIFFFLFLKKTQSFTEFLFGKLHMYVGERNLQRIHPSKERPAKKNHKQHENLIMLTLIVRKLAQLNSTHSHINKDFFYKKNERKRKKKAYHASRVTHWSANSRSTKPISGFSVSVWFLCPPVGLEFERLDEERLCVRTVGNLKTLNLKP